VFGTSRSYLIQRLGYIPTQELSIIKSFLPSTITILACQYQSLGDLLCQSYHLLSRRSLLSRSSVSQAVTAPLTTFQTCVIRSFRSISLTLASYPRQSRQQDSRQTRHSGSPT